MECLYLQANNFFHNVCFYTSEWHIDTHAGTPTWKVFSDKYSEKTANGHVSFEQNTEKQNEKKKRKNMRKKAGEKNNKKFIPCRGFWRPAYP